jgi:membrane-bound lytic murein transglycosylase MltF
MQKMEISTSHGTPTIQTLGNQGLQVRTSMQMDTPKLPIDITEVADEELMDIFSRLTAYNNFLSTQLACAFIDERNAEQDLDQEESVLFLQHYNGKATKDTMTLIKAKVAVEPRIKDLKEIYMARYNYRKLVEVMVNNVERDTSLVSRELTRRTSGLAFRSRGERMFP